MRILIPTAGIISNRQSYLRATAASHEADISWFDVNPKREVRIRRLSETDYSLFEGYGLELDKSTEDALIFITYCRSSDLIFVPRPQVLLPFQKKLQVLQKLKRPPSIERLSMTLRIN
ncbi:MAG: hypothetical protein VYA99_08770 [Pseudomonadota bacterium]|jgi:hypothetical protein|nr:hypothetical protein [Pseudomonadota bacterium]